MDAFVPTRPARMAKKPTWSITNGTLDVRGETVSGAARHLIRARSFEAMPRVMPARALFLAAALMLMARPAHAQDNEDFDPADVSIVDAINCHLDAPTYNGFAFSVGGDDGEARRRHWRKVATGNAFLDEYELPEPIAVTGTYTTRRIAFSSTGVLAILDLSDPAPLAKAEGIANAADPEPLIAEIVASGKATRAAIEADLPFRKFLGERVMVDVTELPADGESFGAHTTIARTISNVTTHRGKTLYGCSYRIELIDKEGKPL